jgi:quercetin dioxygenase-like cupin family protein
MAITFYRDCRTYELDKGVLFRDMQTKETGTGILSVGTATFDPGRYLPCHRHNTEEVIVILEGNAFVDVAGVRTPMEVYDSSHVPEGDPHRFVNASKIRPLTILWIYATLDVARLVTHYSECMGDSPPEPGEEGYIATRPAHLAELSRSDLVSEITAQVMASLKRNGRTGR